MDRAPTLFVVLTTYFLSATIIILLNVTFLTKLFGPVVSNERTLLLFGFNVAQAILTFAIWYRFVLDLGAGRALFEALLVFGTIGYPEGADTIVSIQIATDFMLVAVFLAVFVGNLGRPKI